jgi:hypothetical protein
MGLILPRNWCLIFFRDPKGQFTPEYLKQLLIDARLTSTGDQQPFEVRRAGGPSFYVSVLRSSSIETIARRLAGPRRKYSPFIPGCDTQIKIELTDVDEALDEINTLIELQSLLQNATKGLTYLGWNQAFSCPDDEAT